MSIRRNQTLPVITADDLQFTHRGRTLAVEFTDFGDFRFVMLVESVGQTWVQASPPWERCSDQDILSAGGPAMWIKEALVPKLNLWLSGLFPASADTAGLPLLDQVDLLLKGSVKFVPKADGTVQAVHQ